MFLSDPPESDLAKTLYDEDRQSDGYVSNTTRLWCTAVNAALGAQPDAQLAEAAPAAVRTAVSYGRPPAGALSV